MPLEAVIEEKDKDFSIYEVPLSLVDNKLDELIVEKLGVCDAERSTLDDWRDLLHRLRNPQHEISIAVVGKYAEHRDAYKSIYEAIDHAGMHHQAQVRVGTNPKRRDRTRRARALAGGLRRHPGARRISANAASKAKSKRFASPASEAFRSSASAWACSAP